MFKNLRADIRAAKLNDPAARNWFEILLTYSGVHALYWYRIAHFFHKIKFKLLARIISQTTRFFTGIEIHPAAKIDGGVFIDHGSGVVIGETAEVHKGTVIYQGVTLGGTGKERGKRHPTVMENVTLSAGAKVLGGVTVGLGALSHGLKVVGSVQRVGGGKCCRQHQHDQNDGNGRGQKFTHSFFHEYSSC